MYPEGDVEAGELWARSLVSANVQTSGPGRRGHLKIIRDTRMGRAFGSGR
jgi:hypothetical protein